MAQPARRSAARTRQVTDPDDRERAAIAAGLKLMAELMAEIGWTTRFNQLTEPQARALAEAAIDGFLEAMALSAAAPRSGGAVLMDARPRLQSPREAAGLRRRGQRLHRPGARRRECAPGRSGTTSAAAASARAAAGGCSTSTSRRRRTRAPSSPASRCASSPSATCSRTWRSSGCARPGSISGSATGTASSSASPRPAGGCRATPTAWSSPRRTAWRCRRSGSASRPTRRTGATSSSAACALAKPIYAAQIALYQAYLGLTEAPALFTAINKDTCELWHELVPFDGALAQAAERQGGADPARLRRRRAAAAPHRRSRALRMPVLRLEGKVLGMIVDSTTTGRRRRSGPIRR